MKHQAASRRLPASFRNRSQITAIAAALGTMLFGAGASSQESAFVEDARHPGDRVQVTYGQALAVAVTPSD